MTVLQYAAGSVRQVAALATGTPPGRIGWSPGPLVALRHARHRGLRRPVRVCLLELHRTGTRFAANHAYWVNERSAVCSAVVNERPENADVVWVFTQDPLTAATRAGVEAALARVPPAVPVLNRPGAYDAYHRDDAFPRLAAAGARVPRHTFGPADLGHTAVVYKAQGEQSSRKFSCPYRGPKAGYRAFGLEDGTGPDGLVRRYRAYYLAGLFLAGDVVAARGWEVTAHARESVVLTYEPTAHEREQVALLARTLELDFFAVDYLRRADDGLPVFLDVNVYPTTVLAEDVTRPLGVHGQWHVWSVPELSDGPPPGGPYWERFDATMLALARGLPVVAA